jgi:hypothetical protein
MAGLVPAIHVLICWSIKDVDARHNKAGHDERIRTKNLRREGQMGPCLTDAARGAAPDEAIRARAATPKPE